VNRPVRVLGGVDVAANRTEVHLNVDGFVAVLTPGEARAVAGLLLASAQASEEMRAQHLNPPAGKGVDHE